MISNETITRSVNDDVQPDSYASHWIVLILLAALGIGGYHWHTIATEPVRHYQAPPVAAPGVRWFLMLRMPAISAQYESGIDTMKSRYDDWLSALAAAGYQPMKLSDVIERLRRNEGLPEKAVVLEFDPGMRRTYRLIAPILASRHWPGVWMTNEDAMRHGHREYVTYHAADLMLNSGWWDVGFKQSDGTINLKTSRHGTIQLGSTREPAWAPMSGGMALNRGQSVSMLNRLNVNSDWKKDDLLNRVSVEVPIERAAWLTEGGVQNLTWGEFTENSADPATTLNLQVLPYKRGLVLDWFGTAGISEFKLESEAKSLVGEFCMRLRWDEARGDGITVLVSKDQWAILEMSGNHLVKKWVGDRYAHDGSGFRSSLTLRGDRLAFVIDGESPVQMDIAAPTGAGRGIFQLFLVDKFRGTARADGVRMRFTPIAAS